MSKLDIQITIRDSFNVATFYSFHFTLPSVDLCFDSKLGRFIGNTKFYYCWDPVFEVLVIVKVFKVEVLKVKVEVLLIEVLVYTRRLCFYSLLRLSVCSI